MKSLEGKGRKERRAHLHLSFLFLLLLLCWLLSDKSARPGRHVWRRLGSDSPSEGQVKGRKKRLERVGRQEESEKENEAHRFRFQAMSPVSFLRYRPSRPFLLRYPSRRPRSRLHRSPLPTSTRLHSRNKPSIAMSDADLLPLPPPGFFSFPYETPYPIQTELMHLVYQAIEGSKIAIVQSPTGTVSLVKGGLEEEGRSSRELEIELSFSRELILLSSSSFCFVLHRERVSRFYAPLSLGSVGVRSCGAGGRFHSS